MSQIEFRGAPLATLANTLLFVQLNDVYQIDAAADYRDQESLTLPRLTTLMERLRQRWGDRALLCLPGDFLAPSAMSQKYMGAQMVDVLNSVGLDLVCLGNHEFDVDREDAPGRELLKRVEESQFEWLCSNFEWAPTVKIAHLEKKIGQFKLVKLSHQTDVVLVGLLMGMELKDTKGAGVAAVPVAAMPELIPKISSTITHAYPDRRTKLCFVALTHQDLADDERLAQAEKRLHLILGGHDHEVTEAAHSGCVIAKACSNARTIRLNFLISIPSILTAALTKAIDTATVMKAVAAELVDQCVSESLGAAFAATSYDVPITEALVETAGPFVHWIDAEAEDETIFVISVGIKTDHPLFLKSVPCSQRTKERILHWAARANTETFPPFNQRLAIAPTTLHLQDRLIRSQSTNFGVLTADVLRDCFHWSGDAEAPADVGIIHGGTFRLDRDIHEGEWITQGTLCEIFFYDNRIQEFRLRGSDLLDILTRSQRLRSTVGPGGQLEGHGQFVQIAGLRVACGIDAHVITVDAVSLLNPARRLLPDEEYSVVTTEYLATAGEYYNLFHHPAIRTARLTLRALVAASLPSMLKKAESQLIRNMSQGWVDRAETV